MTTSYAFLYDASMYFVYILTNIKHTVLYIGITRNLAKRTYQHKTSVVQSFSSKYKTKKLIYYEQYTDVRLAIEREKQLKKWNRAWKETLINKLNPEWNDLYNQLYS